MSQQAEHEEIKKKVLSTGIRVGTEVKTKFMIPYIIQANPEGLYLFDLDITLSRIQTAARFIKKFDIEKVIVYSGRVYATTPIEKFCELTGAKKMLGRFMPGTLTNPSLPYYSEPLLIIISDPQVDAQAVTEATNAGIPVIGIANTDNVTSKLDLVIPANNRGRKALATVYWLLAREILQDSKTMKYEIEDFETKTAEVEEEL
ncbi:30S ribosomal protein S2 [Marine Group I thaumarchaeote]|jgi:small subunit ribosomal protein S2|uniref:Small ribosomal subunit protein uS2 n=1 Tax=Marine Group I thaumarchaeote TaxID=2511932 RepID=A0A7K4N271_9ARCH|nr:30S ribosomal protein S2 [Marine Group I thaumarchaeote]NWJ99372.1 30S ribosomal protein S2 [Marine Group I thaumarchaeote]PBO82275.1 MAG: 30S ribosomal protein S2 [Nitrosopumilales archaeon]